MKTLQNLIILALFLIQTVGLSQTKTIENSSKIINTEKVEQTKVEAKQLEKFVGKYDLSEGNITLEIVKEKGKMFIISPWSKDPLKIQDKNTLIEPTRGVYLSIIKNDDKALKYFQNGYETTIKRIKNSK